MADTETTVVATPPIDGAQTVDNNEEEVKEEELVLVHEDDVDEEEELETASEILGLDQPGETGEDKSGNTDPPPDGEEKVKVDAKSTEVKKTEQKADPDVTTSKVFADRLGEARAKDRTAWEKEQHTALGGKTLEEARKIIIDAEADKLMADNPSMNMTKEFAVMTVQNNLGGASVPAANAPEQQEQTQSREAFKAQAEKDIRAIQIFDPEFDFKKTYEESEVFRNALQTEKDVLDAYKAKKEHDAKSDVDKKAIKAEGAKEAAEKIKQSKSKALNRTDKGAGGDSKGIALKGQKLRDFNAYVKEHGSAILE